MGIAVDFIGIDLGWENKPSGLAHLQLRGQSIQLISYTRRTGVSEVLAWLDKEAGDSALAAVDAPLVITNAAGMRPIDRLMHNHFGRFHAGCYPANLGRKFAALTTGFSKSLDARGFIHGDELEPRQTGRYQIEVHPHAAIVHLFNLQRILKYKKGRIAHRRVELEKYKHLLLTRLATFEPSLTCGTLPEIPARGAALKELEDELDAIVCAYVGAHWWYWGTARNTLYGHRPTGYIVVPNRYCSDLHTAEFGA